MERLIVKNFGPLKDIDIELNKINLFIGENGSGKSVLAKIVTIVLNFNNHLIDEKRLFKKFKEYHIDFFTKKTIIQFFIGQTLCFEIKNKKIKSTGQQFVNEHPIIQFEIKKVQDRLIDENKLTTQYIPAERNLISLFNQSIYSFLSYDIPLPKFILSFFSEFEKARKEITELSFLDVKYVHSEKDRIYYDEDNFLHLEHSSSGIQSALPLYLTVKYFAQKHSSIIIEEPEQNLFPKAQMETIKYIIEQVSSENNLFLMTHSPYVLSTLNTLMMAYKAGILGEEARTEVSKLTKEEQWINPQEFSAYYLDNGIARDIKGRTGLISENEIDDISDDMACDFDELLAIYREHKRDK